MNDTFRQLVQRCRDAGGVTIHVRGDEQRALIEVAEKFERMVEGARRGGSHPKGSDNARKAARIRWNRESARKQIERLRTLNVRDLNIAIDRLRKAELQGIALEFALSLRNQDGELYTRDQLAAKVYNAITAPVKTSKKGNQ